MKPGKLYLVRHGRAFSNIWHGAFADDATNFLTAEGCRQAEALGSRFKEQGIEFAAVFTSELTRTKHTAKIILEAMGQPYRGFHSHAALNERVAVSRGYQNFYNTELEDEVYQRAEPIILQHALPMCAHGNVLVVTHFWVIRVLMNNLPGLSREVMHHYLDLPIKNCEVVEVDLYGKYEESFV